MTTAAVNPTNTFTTNGNATVPELNKFNVQHKADGTSITPQGASGVTGWVHIPISCPTLLAKTVVPRIVGCSVVVATSSDAKIDKFYLSVGSSSPLKKEGLNYQTQFGGLETLSFNDLPPNVRPARGPCISLELKFQASRGLVRISSAAVDLLEN